MGQCIGRMTEGNAGHRSDSAREVPRQHTLESLLAEGPKDKTHGWTVAQLLDRRDFAIPRQVYRSHRGRPEEIWQYGLRRAAGGISRGLDYIVDIFKHSSRQGGSEGTVISLTASYYVARRFHRSGETSLVTIDTSVNRDRYQTTSRILVENADNLLKSKLILPATILCVVEYLVSSAEDELFYLDGDIPADRILDVRM